MFSSDSSSRKTRISAHFLDAAPAEDEVVTVEGWLTYYDEEKKSWLPLEKAQVSIYVDGREVGKADTNEYGMFSFAFPAPTGGGISWKCGLRERWDTRAAANHSTFRLWRGNRS